MNLILLFSILFNTNQLTSTTINDNPVKWEFSVEKDGNDFVFKATAKMDGIWVLYSQDNSGEGPIPTYFEFNTDENITFNSDRPEESGKIISEYDELFETQVNKYKHEATFVRKFTSKTKTGKLKGFVEFMTCDGQRCLPPTDVEFELNY
jgi:thiol:disulfide interchange protein DsbD